jgi:hypothetical protein
MKTSPIHFGAGTVNRCMGFNGVTANLGRWGAGIPLVCAFLTMVGTLSAQAGTEATYKLFGREVGGYSSKDDVPGIVKQKLGPRASIADWEEIKKQFGGSEASLKAFCEKISLAPAGDAWVTQGGKQFWQEQRHYFIYRADRKLPDDFLQHDQMQNNFLLLGSWYGQRPVLVKITDYNATDAAKFAKWDEMLAAKNKVDVSGVYTLVTVNGKKLPAKISHEGADLEVRAGTFTITADGKCTSKVTFVPPSGQEARVDTTATYHREGPTLTMQWQGAGGTTGTVEGNTFTMENEGMVFVYRKRPLLPP